MPIQIFFLLAIKRETEKASKRNHGNYHGSSVFPKIKLSCGTKTPGGGVRPDPAYSTWEESKTNVQGGGDKSVKETGLRTPWENVVESFHVRRRNETKSSSWVSKESVTVNLPRFSCTER